MPDQVDADFLRDFRNLILTEVAKGKKFIIITGGGKLCRRYNQAAEEIKSMTNEELDWLGIAVTRLNAEFVRLLFGSEAEGKIVLDPKSFDFAKPVVLAGGWKPGSSTDLMAVQLAKNIGGKKVINLSNIDYVYDSDPRKNPAAKKLEKISWAEYRRVSPKDWDPGLNSPFDPIASALAEKEGMEVVIMNCKPINNLESYLNGKKFKGTVIS